MKRTLKRGWKDLKPLRRKLWELAVAGYVRRNRSVRSSLQARSVKGRKCLYQQKAGWVSEASEAVYFWVVSEAFWGPRGFCDPAEKASIDPSWNTDQGVYEYCKFAGDKPIGVMKVILRCQGVKTGSISRPWSFEKGMSESNILMTRKMVNYAWVAWSQGKLWWKREAILTCKSFVKLVYRGERLIEPSSSWFPLKFLSG